MYARIYFINSDAIARIRVNDIDNVIDEICSYLDRQLFECEIQVYTVLAKFGL